MSVLAAVRNRLRARRARINARDDRLAATDQDIGSRLDRFDWARGAPNSVHSHRRGVCSAESLGAGS
jgi:hypothetical protein